MRTATLFLSALLLATTASAPRAQVLNGEWFKITLTADGSGYDGEAEKTIKGKLKKTVFYAQFQLVVAEGVDVAYELDTYVPTVEDSWIQSGGGQVEMLNSGEGIISGGSLDVPTAPVTVMEGGPNLAFINFNATCKITMDGEDVKSAKITSVGSMAQFSDTDRFYYGKAKVSMTRVAEDKLPFPVLLAAGKPAPEAKPAVETAAEPQAETKAQAETKPEAAPAKP